MILGVDVGNTNIVIGCLEEGVVKNTVRVRTEPGMTAAEFGIKLRQLFDFFGIESRGFEGAIVSSVVPQVIVLDLGTATTITLIDENKCFRGGAILPGIKLSYAALAAGTSLLPDISITPPKKCVATNTVDCMRSGAVFGTAATIDGMVERMENELGQRCKVVATGGLASSVTPYCRREIVCDDELLLKGLWILYKKNAQ